MSGKNDTKKLHETNDPLRIVEALLKCADERDLSGPRYRILSQNDDTAIISNVPAPIYEKEKPRRYVAPLLSNTNKRLIEFLQSTIDTLQNSEVSDPSALGKGEAFLLNQCYNNSKRLFQFLIHLGTIGVIPKKYKVKIALGYIASKIPFGTDIGDIIVNSHDLILHDWHTWNYIDKILIDLSLFQSGNLLSFESEIALWGASKDHVFGTLPNGISYFGRVYTDLSVFDARIQTYLPQ
jgi:hypothetical protein